MMSIFTIFRRFAKLIVPIVGVYNPATAQTRNITAPYDAFVCINKDIVTCARDVHVDDIFNYLFDTTDDNKLRMQWKSLMLNHISDLTDLYHYKYVGNNGQVSYRCVYAAYRYDTNIDTKKNDTVVFISTPLLISLRNHVAQLVHAEDKCHSLIETFNYEVTHISLEDQVLSVDAVAGYLNNEIQTEIYQKESVGADASIVKSQMDAWGIPTVMPDGGSESKTMALHETLLMSNVKRYQLKLFEYDNLMSHLYRQQFTDAQNEIDYYAAQIADDIMMMNISVVNEPGKTLNHSNTPNGSWVVKGSVVGSIE